MFTSVYGTNSDVDRRLLWDKLAGLISWYLPWYIGSDFNVTRFPSERLGEASFSLTMEEFSNFIFEQGPMNIPLQGGNFTWSNHQNSPSWSKIDKFHISPKWEDHF